MRFLLKLAVLSAVVFAGYIAYSAMGTMSLGAKTELIDRVRKGDVDGLKARLQREADEQIETQKRKVAEAASGVTDKLVDEAAERLKRETDRAAGDAKHALKRETNGALGLEDEKTRAALGDRVTRALPPQVRAGAERALGGGVPDVQ